MPAPKGHPKWGGKRKGSKHKTTLEKAAARELTRAYVTDCLLPILRSQVASAVGIGHLYTRDKAGKFTKIDDPEKVDALLMSGEEGKHFWIFTKDPSTQASTDLLNRAIDKPAEQEQAHVVSGALIVKWQDEA